MKRIGIFLCIVLTYISSLSFAGETRTITIQNGIEKSITLIINYRQMNLDPETGDPEYAQQYATREYSVSLEPNDVRTFTIGSLDVRLGDAPPSGNVLSVQEVLVSVEIDGQRVLRNQQVNAGEYEFKRAQTGYVLEKIY